MVESVRSIQNSGPNSGLAKESPLTDTQEAVVKPFRANGHTVSEKSADQASWLENFSEFRELNVVFDAEPGILWCTMSPVERPSVTLGLAHESRLLQRTLKDLAQSYGPEEPFPIRYVVWCSDRPGIFNLGGDLRLFAELVRRQDGQALMDYAINCIDVVHANFTSLDLPVITISLVEGDALGGGMEAAISSDVVIAERTAKFGLPEILFNLFPGMGAYSLIARRVNGITAERMIMSGRVYVAEELYEIGLVDFVVEAGEGRGAIEDFVGKNGWHHRSHTAIYQAGRRVNPLTYQELRDIAELWVDSVMNLGDGDLRRMERLAAAQDRRHKR